MSHSRISVLVPQIVLFAVSVLMLLRGVGFVFHHSVSRALLGVGLFLLLPCLLVAGCAWGMRRLWLLIGKACAFLIATDAPLRSIRAMLRHKRQVQP
jgi:hypothetical protein